ncbi:hypothetical protein [Moorena sp. SIO4G3]|uniref:hypothetical protein n=1 Tax=Moorena sp. SIO4G3 TaxID=2607821 RepID=UPI0014294F9F|nr:hypothetical protein [Moorena sp. SIO4G3]NEO80552.1 hypothetical protein [Moorena sp. SIO4G3]
MSPRQQTWINFKDVCLELVTELMKLNPNKRCSAVLGRQCGLGGSPHEQLPWFPPLALCIKTTKVLSTRFKGYVAYRICVLAYFVTPSAMISLNSPAFLSLNQSPEVAKDVTDTDDVQVSNHQQWNHVRAASALAERWMEECVKQFSFTDSTHHDVMAHFSLVRYFT